MGLSLALEGMGSHGIGAGRVDVRQSRGVHLGFIRHRPDSHFYWSFEGSGHHLRSRHHIIDGLDCSRVIADRRHIGHQSTEEVLFQSYLSLLHLEQIQVIPV
jgi:hypothetical protein